MTCLLYLVYKENYTLAKDKGFLDWLAYVRDRLCITHLVIVDNFDTRRAEITLNLRDIDVTVIPGNNDQREFSGYLVGLKKMPICRRYVLLNDTFLQKKHAPYRLLVPAIEASLKKLTDAGVPLLIGEINRAPRNANFGGVNGIDWISSYCFLFADETRSFFTASIEQVKSEFCDSTKYLGNGFVNHINRQVQHRAGSESVAWMDAKYRATSTEIRLSQILRERGGILYCMYSRQVSLSLFTKNVFRKIIRRLRFELKFAV